MPPYIEVDSHQDDDFGLQLARPPLVLSTDQPSPLFLDYESVNPQLSPTASTSQLSRRQSDPDFTALVIKDDPAKKAKEAAKAAPVVSVITAIIGPESAYVRTANTKADSANGKSTATAVPTAKSSSSSGVAAKVTKQQPKKAAQPSPSKSTPSVTSKTKSTPANTNKSAKGKIERPILLKRATHYVSKKGWKVVKSLPKRVASSVASVKVPGHYRNVV